MEIMHVTPPSATARFETPAEKQRRLTREAALLAEGFNDVSAGRVIDADKVDAWIDSLGTDHELPVPRCDC